MRLRRKWLAVPVGGGIVLTLGVATYPDALFVIDLFDPVATVANVVLWPVHVCVYLSGPGPSIGPPEKQWHEWTPVQDFAVAAGIGLSWMFYSTLTFVTVRLRGRQRAAQKHRRSRA